MAVDVGIEVEMTKTRLGLHRTTVVRKDMMVYARGSGVRLGRDRRTSLFTLHARGTGYSGNLEITGNLHPGDEILLVHLANLLSVSVTKPTMADLE